MEVINSSIEQSYYEPEASEPPVALTGPVRAALDSAFSQKTVEGILESLESYKESSDVQVKTWATSTLETLNLRSPTSLRVALFALRNNKDGGLIDALQTELGIATALCVRHPRNSHWRIITDLRHTEWRKPRFRDRGNSRSQQNPRPTRLETANARRGFGRICHSRFLLALLQIPRGQTRVSPTSRV
jgi:hypothetical protein